MTICIFLISVSVSAYSPNILNFSPETYGGANKNWSIGADEFGTIYIGNDRGLVEFDGVSWKLSQLPSKGIVRSLGVASSQAIYVGGTEEFGVWKRGISGNLEYTSLSKSINFKDLKNSDFWRTMVTSKGVYFQSFSSIFFYDFKTVRKLNNVQNPIMLLNEVRGDFLFQQMKGVVYILKGGKIEEFPGSDIFKNTDIRLILPYGKAGYLFATNTKGLIVYEDGKYHDLNKESSLILSSKDINNGLLTRKGTYVLGTLLDGVYEVDMHGKIINHFSADNVLQSNTVLSIGDDNLGNIWLGMGSGVSCISSSTNLDYFTKTTSRIGSIYTACLWKGNLLLGTNQGVFYLPESSLKNSSSLAQPKLIPGTQGQVWNLHEIDGTLFYCHNNGLSTIDANLHAQPFLPIGTGVFNIRKIEIENTQYLALSTYLSVKIIDVKTKKIYSPKGVDEPIYDTQVDHLGNLWMEHNNRGVYRCRWVPGTSTFSQIHYYRGINENSIPTKLQLFKVGGRANMIGDGKIYHYNDIDDRVTPDKILDSLFLPLEPVKKVFPLSPSLFCALAEKSFYLFTYDGYHASVVGSQGVGHNLHFLDIYQNIIPLNDSLSFISLDGGFIICNFAKIARQNLHKNKKLPVPVIRALKSISSKEKSFIYFPVNQETIKVKNAYNTIEISYVVKNGYASYVACQYKLDGVDMEWSSKSYLNKVVYERLPVGNYTFRVRAMDLEGNVSSEAVLHFRINPPWYASWWAYLFYFLLAIAIFFIFRAWSIARYQKKQIRKIRRLETERLKALASELQAQVDKKNAELVTQTSFIIQKNELIEKVRTLIDDFYVKNKSTVLQQLIFKINNLLNNNLNTDEDWRNFLIKFEEKHPDFFRNLKNRYEGLTSTDLRLCACLKLNMETKDIASLMNLSIRAIENNRYRLRKKLDLKTEQNLNEFLIAFD